MGTPPDAGLDGTLSICVTPVTTNWTSVSLMAQLEKKYNWPTIYISYYFIETNLGTGSLYKGYVEFANETPRVDDMTFGGQIVI